MAMLRRALINAPRFLHSSGVPARTPLRVVPAIRTENVFRSHDNLFSRFCSGNGSDSHAMNVDLSDEESKRRLFNGLLYRSKQRGFLELDLVLGRWVEDNINSMDENGIKALLQVLDLENPDLWKWLSGQEHPPETVSKNPVFSALYENVMKNLRNYSAPETRATAGQPWVRGWDDFKKGRDTPICGNQ